MGCCDPADRPERLTPEAVGTTAAAARVLIVDDHRGIRDGLRALLIDEPTLRVIGEAESGDEALGIALVLRPDLIILDDEMPGTRGLDVLPKLKVVVPGARIVMFTMSAGIARRARIRGAEAVIAKDDFSGLVAALRRLAAEHRSRAPSSGAWSVGRRAWWDVGRARLGLLVGLAVLYIALFPPLLHLIGEDTIEIAVVVVAAGGALYGLRGGLAAAILAVAMNTLLLRAADVSLSETARLAHVVIAITIGAAVGGLRDLAAHARAQTRTLADSGAALEASDRRLLGLVEHAPVLLVTVDTAGVIVDALGTGFGDHPMFSPERMRGQQCVVFYAENPELLARLARALTGEEFSERVERYGFVYDVHLGPRHDASGVLIGVAVALINVTGRVRAEEGLERAALHDPLTGLPNRQLLDDRLHQALRAAKRTNGGVAVLVLGVDGFKSVNNTYGHGVGDVLLRELAIRLQATVREVDTLARFSGDEFAAVLPECPAGGEGAVAQKVRQALAEPFTVAQQRLDVGVSIGVACYPQDGIDPQTLLRKAEIGMYTAKRSRASFETYRPEMERHGAPRLTLMTELRTALEHGGLALHYQPVVAVPSGSLMMVEALLRWDHPARGMIPPMDFIPLAEESDLMKPLTDWVLATAIDQCRRWLATGWRVPVAVNLSMRNLTDAGLAPRISALLSAAGLPATSLTIEMTESVLMADAPRSLETLWQLRRIGIDLAIDDFGTGYSSLAYLGRFPINAVKVDRTFVGSMLSDPTSLAIVEATVKLTHALGFKAIAEGVESSAVLARLGVLGCDLAQGYHIARPMPAELFVPWLAATARSLDPADPADPAAGPQLN